MTTSPRRFVPRNVEAVEAMQVEEPFHDVAAWCGGFPVRGGEQRPNVVIGIHFTGPRGANWFAEPGDWIVKDQDGVFRCLPPATFEADFEVAR